MRARMIRAGAATTLLVAALVVAAGPAEAAKYRQDMLIKLKGDAKFLGNNIYNDAGGAMGEQTRTTAIERSRSAIYIIKAQNDGTKRDRLRIALGIEGGKNGKWKVAFFKGTKDVTSLVKGSGYVTSKLDPGESRKIRAEITNVDPAAPCNCADLYIDAYSFGKGDASVDTVRAKTDDKP